MGVLGTMARTAADGYPALLLILAVTIAANLYAYRRRRFSLMAATMLTGALVTIFYTGEQPVEALGRLEGSGPAVTGAAGVPPPAVLPPDSKGTGRSPRDRARPANRNRWASHLPDDFRVPPVFQIEYSSSRHSRSSTIRYRFRGEPSAAVRDLRDLGTASGWEVEVKAPHRLVFRKGDRTIEAWFSYPARSVVLDITDRG